MLRRRTLGPAYERCPSETISEWTNRNLLILIAAIVGAILFMVVTNLVVEYLMNFLASGGDEMAERRFDSNHWTAVTVKIVGGIMTAYLVCKGRAK